MRSPRSRPATRARAVVGSALLLVCACTTAPAQTATDSWAGGDDEPSELESVGARKGLGPTTAAMLDALFTVQVDVAAVTTEKRITLATRTGNAAVVEHHIVTARRLLHPEEYEPDLALAAAEHRVAGATVEVTATFVSFVDGTVFVWPAPAGLGAQRGLDLGPERVSPLEAHGTVRLRTGEDDLSALRVRGRPPGARGWTWQSDRWQLSPVADELFVIVGAAHKPSGEVGLWRAVTRLSGDLRVAAPGAGSPVGAPVARLEELSPIRVPVDVLGVVTHEVRGRLVVSPLMEGIVQGRVPHVENGPMLTGRLLDRRGQPVPWVQLESYAGAQSHPDMWLDMASTSEDGAFALRRSVDAPTLVVQGDDEPVALAAPFDTSELVITLEHAVPRRPEPPQSPAPEPWTGILVRVRDAETLAPPADVRVIASSEGVAQVLSGTHGVFELRGASPGTWEVTVDAGPGRRSVHETLSVVEGQIALLDVKWEGASIAIGRSQGVPGPPLPETVGRAVDGAPPTWFTLEGNVYFAGTVEKAVQALLDLDSGPRWFGLERGPPPAVLSLPVTDRGARLDLRATHGAPGELSLQLDLHAGPNGLCREVEHRATNLIPFLFALEAEGAAVVVDSGEWAKFGGMNALVELVAPNQTRTWSLRLRAASLDRVVPRPFPRRIAMTAAFCEVQHDGWFAERPPLPPIEDRGLVIRQPVLIRSQPVVLERTAEGWVPTEQRQ